MGTEEDNLSVVTPDLKVKEIENLRIFDASVMPNIISGNTNAPTLALADRAVDIMQNITKVL
jgi:choline dehydrogenase-like flavoprotein